ncbi:MAG: T9SS type A sorting domain-containing protein, partial [Bacteroidota bacterium]
FPSDESELALLFTTPQLKAIDLDEHGYAVLDLTPERAQTDWYFVEDIRTEGGGETYFAGLFTASGENRLQPAAAPAPSKAEAPALAPMGEAAARAAQAASEAAPTEALLFSGVYPSPARGDVVIGYALNRAMDVRVAVYDVLGREVAVIADRRHEAGDYALGASLSHLAAGTYVVRVEADGAVATRTITLQ